MRTHGALAHGHGFRIAWRLGWGLLLGGLLAAGEALGAEEPALAQARQRMVAQQLQGRDIRDPVVLKAMGRVPRHEFVSPRYRAEAYADTPLPIEEGQTISQPYIVALMTQLLGLTGTERVLEVGTGSGYQAAVLAEITPHVYSIEILPGLAKSAADRLRALGYARVRVRAGDGYQGWPEAAPFDGILVTAGATHMPEPLVAQLREGGRIVIPVGERWGVQELFLGTKVEGRLRTQVVAPVRFVPLVEPKR
jgi:protein-L-isoaspartate(D-aspartate) O-methyltransferase